jgi:Flp pilus assembly protein TadD
LAEAEAAYRAVVRLDRQHAFAHSKLGDVLRKQRRHADAIAAYRAALAIQPSHTDAREGLGYCERVLRGEVPTAPPPRAVAR